MQIGDSKENDHNEFLPQTLLDGQYLSDTVSRNKCFAI